ncbi:MAG: insulinase family protein [Candidatus Peribacteraceae bacterium]|nr:insulinase family protein [Candidatus Peribacteraceae bacterium]
MESTTLPNGLKVVTQKIDGTAAITVLVLAGAGSRYETRERNGLSHFLEHMFFKGGEKFQNTKEVSEAIDSVGGEFNAFTGKEYAGYFVKVAATHTDIAFDVLSDMLVHAKFPAEEIEKERGVILEEYNMYQDTPMYQVGWDFERLLFGDQPMGWDQIGSKENIRNFQRDDFVNYKKELYQPGNLVVAVAGNCGHADIVSKVEKFFKFENGQKSLDWQGLEKFEPESPVKIQNKKTEQGHLVLGVKGVAAEDERHWTQRVLAIILGGNMSSRMFLSVREAKGLCYYIRTNTDDYTDAGVVSTSAGVDLKRLPLAVSAIRAEYEKIAAEKVDAEELTRAKEFLKGKLTLRLEDSEEYAHLLGKQFLLYEEQLELEEIFAKIDAVTDEDIQKLAQEIFVPANLRLAAIGPFEGREAELTKLLK